MNLFKECMNCTDREVGCHGWCESYIKARGELDRRNAAASKERDSKDYTCDVYRRNLTKHMQKRRKG